VFTRPATESFYLVAGRNVLVQAFDDWSRQAVAQTFAGWFITPNPGQPPPTVDLVLRVHCGVTPPAVPPALNKFSIAHGGTCSADNETFYVEFEKSLVVFGPASDVQVDLWIDSPPDFSTRIIGQLLSHALSPALRRCGVFEIHSAGVIAPGSDKAILIAGPSGSGKSTLTTQLANCGWGYLSDDVLLLHDSNGDIFVEPFRRFFALTSDTIAAANLDAIPDADKQKTRIVPQEIFEREAIKGAQPGTIIFSAVTDADRSSLKPLTSAESMTRLLRLCPWAAYDKTTSTQHLQILGRLAKSTAGFDLFAAKDMLLDRMRAAELIEQSVSKAALVH
jgi:hypothetical protein